MITFEEGTSFSSFKVGEVFDFMNLTCDGPTLVLSSNSWVKPIQDDKIIDDVMSKVTLKEDVVINLKSIQALEDKVKIGL